MGFLLHIMSLWKKNWSVALPVQAVACVSIFPFLFRGNAMKVGTSSSLGSGILARCCPSKWDGSSVPDSSLLCTSGILSVRMTRSSLQILRFLLQSHDLRGRGCTHGVLALSLMLHIWPNGSSLICWCSLVRGSISQLFSFENISLAGSGRVGMLQSGIDHQLQFFWHRGIAGCIACT